MGGFRNGKEKSTRFHYLPIHFLQRAVPRLGVEEIHRGHHEGVDDGEDDVRLVPDVVECDRGNDYDARLKLPALSTITKCRYFVLGRWLFFFYLLTTRKLKIQFAEVDRALAGARILRGTISAG